jgi:hypothetical protein
VISIVAPSSCCVTAPLWRCDAESGSHPPHLVWGAASSNANGDDGREAAGGGKWPEAERRLLVTGARKRTSVEQYTRCLRRGRSGSYARLSCVCAKRFSFVASRPLSAAISAWGPAKRDREKDQKGKR